MVSDRWTWLAPSVAAASGLTVMWKLFTVPGPPSQLLAASCVSVASSFGSSALAASRPAFWFGVVAPEVTATAAVTPAWPTMLSTAGLALVPTGDHVSPAGAVNFTS